MSIQDHTMSTREYKSQIKVRFFAAARERAHRSEEMFVLPESHTLGALKRALYLRYPTLEPLDPYMSWAVNHELITQDEYHLNAGDEVALIPPISGG